MLVGMECGEVLRLGYGRGNGGIGGIGGRRATIEKA